MWLGESGDGQPADLTAGWEATGGSEAGSRRGTNMCSGTEDRSLERSTARETQATAGD